MENGPAIFAGMVFCLFGGGLSAWIATSVRRRRPVAHGVSQVASVTVASLVSLASLAVGTWCFTRL